MRNILKWTLSVVLLLSGLSLTSCQEDEKALPQTARLTASEEATLLHMREEEKLARDVYQHLGAKYGLPIFSNIAASEQRHVDFVLNVMAEYAVEDKSSDEAGLFTLPELQALYQALTEKGDSSLLDALWVGATIEELDIKDLNEAIGNTHNADLIDLYELLRCGSGNHIQAFIRQIEGQGAVYVPKYISQDELDAILAGGHQACSL